MPRPAAGLTFDYQHRPLAIYDANGEVQSAVIGHVLTAHLGASVTLIDRIRVGFNLPVVPYTEGTRGFLDGVEYPAPSSNQALGDLRFGADVRLAGRSDGLVTAAFGGRLWMPTGSKSTYTGDESVRGGPRLSIAGTITSFVYSAQAGVMFRDPKIFAGSPVDHDLVFGVAAGAKIGKITVGPELYGSTVLADAAFKTRTTPLEILLGTHVALGSGVRAGLGIGTGLVAGYGSPNVRALASIEWVANVAAAPVAAPPPSDFGPDLDGDGVPDAEDACMDAPGPRSNKGCPTTKVEPPPPAEPEPEPPPPPAPPPAAEVPLAEIRGTEIRIKSQVKFKTGSAEIVGADSLEVLNAVADLLKQHPEVQKLRIAGHTDNKGVAAANQKLSENRAGAVKNWLVAHGVAAGRLSSAGFGGDQPIESNSTDEGRTTNRRVEFHIEQAGK